MGEWGVQSLGKHMSLGGKPKQYTSCEKSNSQSSLVIKVLQWHRISAGSPQDGCLIYSMKRQRQGAREGWGRRGGVPMRARKREGGREWEKQSEGVRKGGKGKEIIPTTDTTISQGLKGPLSVYPLHSPPPFTNNAKTWQPTQHMSNSFPSERGSHPTALASVMSEEWRAL